MLVLEMFSSGYMIYNGSNLDFNVYTNPTFGNTTLLTREALAIRAGGSERMRITSGGEVLIGNRWAMDPKFITNRFFLYKITQVYV
jgi:hypothetical protein